MTIHARRSLLLGTLANVALAYGCTGISQADQDWPQGGHDLRNSNSASGSSIRAGNVDQLQQRWGFTYVDDGCCAQAGVVVADSTLYVSHDVSGTRAFDLASGDLLFGPVALGGWLTDQEQIDFDWIASTPVIGGDFIYVTDAAGYLTKIDRSTGVPEWNIRISPLPPPGGADGVGVRAHAEGDWVYVPNVRTEGSQHRNLLLGGLSPLEYAFVIPFDTDYVLGGSVVAYDADDGSLVWSTSLTSDQTVRDIGGITHHPRWGAGVGSWTVPAGDLQTESLFVGTGNASEDIVHGGPYTPETADDPDLTDSVLELDIGSGEIRRFIQLWRGTPDLPYDHFNEREPYGAGITDLDVNASIGLMNTRVGGKTIPIIVAVAKSGFIHAIRRDRPALEILWERELGEPTYLVGSIQGFSAHLDRTVKHKGRTHHGIIYQAATAGLGYQPGQPRAEGDDRSFADVVKRYAPDDDQTDDFAQLTYCFLNPAVQVILNENTESHLYALDAATGEIIWHNVVPGIGYGSMSMANDVVFWGGHNGKIYAFHYLTGEELWSDETPVTQLVVPVGDPSELDTCNLRSTGLKEGDTLDFHTPVFRSMVVSGGNLIVPMSPWGVHDTPANFRIYSIPRN